MYSRKDLAADVLVVAVLLGMAYGGYRSFKAILPKVRALWNIKEISAVPVGTPVDYGWTIQTLDGKEVRASDFKGKVVFLNFWATWCGPCKMEMPSIEKLSQRYQSRGVVFLIVSEDSLSDLALFQAKTQTTLPLYRVAKIPAFFQVSAFPTTYILSRAGKVALGHPGARFWNKTKTTELLDGLLQESPGKASST